MSMSTVTKLSLWKNSLLLAAFLVVELTGIGPIAKYRVGECYALFAETGAPVLGLAIYTLFFLVWPILDILAILLNPRIIVGGFGFLGR
jgi:hypothetical protein